MSLKQPLMPTLAVAVVATCLAGDETRMMMMNAGGCDVSLRRLQWLKVLAVNHHVVDNIVISVIIVISIILHSTG